MKREAAAKNDTMTKYEFNWEREGNYNVDWKDHDATLLY